MFEQKAKIMKALMDFLDARSTSEYYYYYMIDRSSGSKAFGRAGEVEIFFKIKTNLRFDTLYLNFQINTRQLFCKFKVSSNLI